MVDGIKLICEPASEHIQFCLVSGRESGVGSRESDPGPRILIAISSAALNNIQREIRLVLFYFVL